jgi:hypothetical protein
MNHLENFISNQGFTKVANPLQGVADSAKYMRDRWNDMGGHGKVYTGLGAAGYAAGRHLAPAYRRGAFAITEMPSRLTKGRAGLYGAAALAGTKGIIDYSSAYEKGKIGKADLGYAAGSAGIGALGARALGFGRRGGLIGAGLGLGAKMYSDYKSGRVGS